MRYWYIRRPAFERGYLKRFSVLGILFAFVLLAYSAPLAFVALSPASLNSGKLPVDWQIKVNHGRPDVSVCANSDVNCVHLKSDKASFGLERSVDVDPAQMPFLAWTWKVKQLPQGGDFRHTTTDDQAAQVLVAFADRKVISYIWDTSAPKGTAVNTSFLPMVHVYDVVCESGSSQIDQWLAEARNVAEDYRRAYDKPAPHIHGIRIQINSQHTGTVAESYFGEVAFRNTPK
jgi:hypothetical protein